VNALPINLLLGLAWRFALISAISFGGPSAVLPETHRLFVEDGHWISDERFTALFALAQISPGLNTMYAALFGWQVAGPAGAAVSAAMMYGPSSVLAWLVERYTGRHQDAVWMVIGRRALAPISIALLLASGYLITRGADHSPQALALTLATVALGLWTRLNPLWLVALAAALGVAGVVH